MTAHPWYDDWLDEYAFDVADFPTAESVREWAAKEWGPMTALELHGPDETRIHDHDEDEPCVPSPQHCREVRMVRCWTGEPSDEWVMPEDAA